MVMYLSLWGVDCYILPIECVAMRTRGHTIYSEIVTAITTALRGVYNNLIAVVVYLFLRDCLYV